MRMGCIKFLFNADEKSHDTMPSPQARFDPIATLFELMDEVGVGGDGKIK